MLPARLAILDLETTGTDPTRDRVTEVAVLLVDDGALIEEWSTLVNPGTPIPPEIQSLTGITNDMVREAPLFAEIADELLARLHDRVLVAHNARFDYGFLKNECRRLGFKYSADVLCTVRLSRRLFPESGPHSLDAIVARHGLSAEGRHRALGDARLAWQFLERMASEYSQDIAGHVRALLRTPSLPPQLPQDALAALPEGPGVYVFYGVNDLPLYIGKSVQLKDRVRAHFSSDHMNANDLRLSQEIRRIEFEESAGELGALIREAQWIKSARPLTNRALRRNDEAVFLEWPDPAQAPQRRNLLDLDWKADLPPGLYGPFSSRARIKALLEELAGDHGLCWHVLGVQRAVPGQACFARQLRRCRGACEGVETLAEHNGRLMPALEPWRFPPWPLEGPAVIMESHPERSWSAWHVVDRWCHLGVARDAAQLDRLLESADSQPREFDLDVFRLLWKQWTTAPERFSTPANRSRLP